VNIRQKIVLGVAGVLFLAVGLFPHTARTFESVYGTSLGPDDQRVFVFAIRSSTSSHGTVSYVVNYQKLLLEWVVVLVPSAVAVVMLRTKRKKTPVENKEANAKAETPQS
jgi:hypothetical protein